MSSLLARIEEIVQMTMTQEKKDVVRINKCLLDKKGKVTYKSDSYSGSGHISLYVPIQVSSFKNMVVSTQSLIDTGADCPMVSLALT